MKYIKIVMVAGLLSITATSPIHAADFSITMEPTYLPNKLFKMLGLFKVQQQKVIAEIQKNIGGKNAAIAECYEGDSWTGYSYTFFPWRWNGLCQPLEKPLEDHNQSIEEFVKNLKGGFYGLMETENIYRRYPPVHCICWGSSVTYAFWSLIHKVLGKVC